MATAATATPDGLPFNTSRTHSMYAVSQTPRGPKPNEQRAPFPFLPRSLTKSKCNGCSLRGGKPPCMPCPLSIMIDLGLSQATREDLPLTRGNRVSDPTEIRFGARDRSKPVGRLTHRDLAPPAAATAAATDTCQTTLTQYCLGSCVCGTIPSCAVDHAVTHTSSYGRGGPLLGSG